MNNLTQQKTYDLSGLTWVCAGAIISVAGWFTGIGLLVGFFLSIAGAVKLKDQGERFEKGVFQASLLSALIVLTIVEIISGRVQGTDILVTPSFIIVFACIAFAGYHWYNLLYGCKEIAEGNGDTALGKQCGHALAGFIAVLVLMLLDFRFGSYLPFKASIRISVINQSPSVIILLLWALLIVSVIASATVMRKVRDRYQDTPVVKTPDRD